MTERILTLLVQLEKDSNSWIWDSHMNHEFINGVHVLGICEGNQIENIQEDDE